MTITLDINGHYKIQIGLFVNLTRGQDQICGEGCGKYKQSTLVGNGESLLVVNSLCIYDFEKLIMKYKLDHYNCHDIRGKIRNPVTEINP